VAALTNLDPARLSVAFGWHSARAPLSDADLAALPPVVIVNVSMHGYRLSAAAMSVLAVEQPDLVAHRADGEWIERHLPQVLEFFGCTAGLTPEKLDLFMDDVRRLRIGVVDDMLLPGEAAFDVIRHSRWGARIRCWATPGTFQTLGPSSRLALAGLKIFTDGAIGTRTAALRGSYRDGSRGLLLYTDDQLLQVLGEGHAAGKAVAIHAIGDRAIEQVLTERPVSDRHSF
jgi:predicted amidohydrolase YtcJ